MALRTPRVAWERVHSHTRETSLQLRKILSPTCTRVYLHQAHKFYGNLHQALFSHKTIRQGLNKLKVSGMFCCSPVCGG